jgi:hypothetical protein
MDTIVWILVVIAVVVAAVVIAWAADRQLRTRRLRRRFGAEYDREVERSYGDRRRAEAALGERIARHDELELSELSPSERSSYVRRWVELQVEFVDRPDVAVAHARELVDEVVAARGYPTGDGADDPLALVTVDHAESVDLYRVGHRLHHEDRGDGDPAAATETRRQALLHYRALFADLVDLAEAGDGWTSTALEPRSGSAADDAPAADSTPAVSSG